MYARSIFARGWFAGVLALASGLVGATDCPVDSSVDPYAAVPGWPTTKTEADAVWDGFHVGTGQAACGENMGYAVAWYPTSGSFGSLIAAAHSFLSTRVIWNANDVKAHTATCTTVSGGFANVYVVYQHTHATMPNIKSKLAVRIQNTVIDQTCTVPQAPPQCGDGTEGRLQPTRAASASQVETIIGTCLDGCEVSSVRVDPIGINKDVDGTFYFLPWVKFSGQSCSGGEPDIPPDEPGPDPEPTGEVCKTSAEGTEVCGAPAYGENCGYVNGNFTCLGKTDPDECWIHTDGSRLCGESAPTPPVPDSGTAGVKATPDDVLNAVGPGAVSNEYNYYNTATVAAASRDPGDDGSNPNRLSSTDPRTTATPVVDVGGDGDGDGDGEPAGSASGGESCDTPPACDGDPILCAVLAQQWRTRCVENPTDQELTELLGPVDDEGEIFQRETFEAPSSFDSAGWMGGNACLQDYTLNLGSLMGTVEIPFSEWCWLLEVIGIFVMIAAYVSAARIVMGGI